MIIIKFKNFLLFSMILSIFIGVNSFIFANEFSSETSLTNSVEKLEPMRLTISFETISYGDFDNRNIVVPPTITALPGMAVNISETDLEILVDVFFELYEMGFPGVVHNESFVNALIDADLRDQFNIMLSQKIISSLPEDEAILLEQSRLERSLMFNSEINVYNHNQTITRRIPEGRRIGFRSTWSDNFPLMVGDTIDWMYS